jgi:hypothetical protein
MESSNCVETLGESRHCSTNSDVQKWRRFSPKVLTISTKSDMDELNLDMATKWDTSNHLLFAIILVGHEILLWNKQG